MELEDMSADELKRKIEKRALVAQIPVVEAICQVRLLSGLGGIPRSAGFYALIPHSARCVTLPLSLFEDFLRLSLSARSKIVPLLSTSKTSAINLIRNISHVQKCA